MDDEHVTVLVAEDDPLSRRLLRAILRPPRFTVIEAEDGPEAVRKFADELGIAPGIVVGQLQKKEFITYGQLDHLKDRFKWT